MQDDDQEEQVRDLRLTDQLTAHPPNRDSSGLMLQVGLMMLVFMMMAGALLLVGWVLN